MKNQSKLSFIKCIAMVLSFLLLISLVSCKTSESNLSDDDNESKKEYLDAIGKSALFDEIRFGRYEQDGNYDNGLEDIEWIVIDNENDSVLLLSKYILDVKPYEVDIEVDDDKGAYNWEKSYIRKWLNEDFYNIAFDELEKERLSISDVKNGKVYGINNSNEPFEMGADTKDRVYILSKDEIRKYLGYEFNGMNERYIASYTKFASESLDKNSIDKDFAIWNKERDYDPKFNSYAEYWVRSPENVVTINDYEYLALMVSKDGHLANRGFPYYVHKSVEDGDDKESAQYYNRGIRPVISIKKQIDDVIVYEEGESDFDIVTLGRFEQDNDRTNGKEKIEWIVLEKDDDKMLLMSRYILDEVEYSNVYDKRVTWFNSSLRAYANNEFYNEVFDEREKALILPTKLKTYDNPVYNSIEESETVDKVFIIGFDECMKYFDIDYDECIKDGRYDYNKPKSQKLITSPTTYAKSKFEYENNKSDMSYSSDFWLRNEGYSGEEPGYKYNSAMYARDNVNFKGAIYDLYTINGDSVMKQNLKLGFRPLIWIDINLLSDIQN